MRRFLNKLFYAELIQSCILHDGMYYLPLDQLVALIMQIIVYMAAFFTAGYFLVESVMAVVRLITHFNKKKYGGKHETLQKGRKDHC